MWIAILRIVIPLVAIVLLAGFLWPRIKRSRENRVDRIEVEAEVVSSQQHDPKSDIPKSATYKPADAEEGKPADSK